ncbi:uncharacterized protein LOC130731974 [Lotus japonicus]|uniref:uncharacterized protein LOC130731974 n=1 Tax=Lotus japonicus TaxID=34305 RepID=UPI00258CD646|nr:uncharacterized protein LOC130731974 [Lotus japonicus]
MMRKLIKFCFEGVDIVMEPELPTKEKKISTPEKTEQPWHKTKEATVIPAKRKNVKNGVCNCVIHCICGMCLKPKTVSPSTPSAPKLNRTNSVSSLRMPICAAGNYGNQTKGTLSKWQAK